MNILILFVGVINRESGTSERVLQVAQGLASSGEKVTLSADIDEGTISSNTSKLRLLPMPKISKLANVLAWIVKIYSLGLNDKFDVVQLESFSFERNLQFFLLLRPISRKFVIVYHDKWFPSDPRTTKKGREQLFFQRYLFNLFDMSITPGQGVKDWFRELHGDIIDEKMIVIPNGATAIDIKKDIRGKYGFDRSSFIALFFGTMNFQPNQEAALALYQMSDYISREFNKRCGKKLIFVVAGIGSEKLPKSESYLPLGFVESLDELLSLPDVIVLPHLPSISGPHIKTIYAFLSKKPVITTPDGVKDMPGTKVNEHFLSFDIDEPNSLLNVLVEVNESNEMVEQMTQNAYLYAKKFSWENISSLHIDLYNKILSN